jgi:tetratricopeptide (TPR) repeat protein
MEPAMAAEESLAELLAAPTPEACCRLFAQERFQSLDLAELLLQRSAEAQLRATREALRLARLARHLSPRLTPPEVAARILARARCLEGNALRLSGDHELAAEAFVCTVPALVEPAERAAFLRGLGLVRWEQGRPDEALALVHGAVWTYDENRTASERAATSLLEGVLLMELGFVRGAARFLGSFLSPHRHPALCGRAALHLACAVEPECPNRDDSIRYFLDKGVSVYPLLANDTEELTSLYRLEARVQAKLGRREEARATLGGLRQHYLEARDLPELALATMDLLALQAAAGEIPGVMAFRRDLEGFEPEEGGPLALMALDRMFALPAEGPWERALAAGAWLLPMLRFSHIPTRPVPFA